MSIYKSAGHNILTTPTINVGSDATGDLYYRSAGGIFTRLAKGSQYQVVRAGATLPEYASVKDIIVLGSDATGDIYYRNASGEFTKLSIGATSYLLKSGGTIPAWAAPNSIITLGGDADGDMYYRSGGVLARLAKGAEDQSLIMKSDIPTWTTNTSTLSLGHITKQSGCIRWKDADEIYIPGNLVDCDGKICPWHTQLTFQAGSGGSNAASSNLGNNQFHYIYIDYSTVTSNTALTAANFLNSTTAPTYSDSKKGRYNGSDRCIGVIRTSGAGAILDFVWDVGYYEWMDGIGEGAANLSDFTDMDLTSSVPNFGAMAVVLNLRFYSTGAGGSYDVELSLRTNGKTPALATTGRLIGTADSGSLTNQQQVMLYTDTAQVIEAFMSPSSGNSYIFTKGFMLSV